jgi:NAD+ kinase
MLMQNIGLVANIEKSQVLTLVKEIVTWLEKKGQRVVIPDSCAAFLGRSDLTCPDRDWPTAIDCAVILGGDGTLLNTARSIAPAGVPLFGINLGQLGFLTEVEVEDTIPALEKLISGTFLLEERMMLQASVRRGGKVSEKFICLNDAVITKGAFARLIRLQTFVNEEYVETYPADGLIVSTPTGSTAYSLSAGGPLVTPDMELMIVTPICPHTLYARPLVIDAANTVKVVILSDQGEIMLTLDGQYGFSLQPGDEVIIEKAPYKTKLLKINRRSFYEILREKLKEGVNSDV